MVITIIFEDYLKNPTILKNVFDQAGISPYVLLKDNWGDGFTDWPTLNDMRRLGRLVVFNNNGLHGFPYTEFNMWRYVRENRYGTPSRKKRVCSRVKVSYQTNNSLNMQGKNLYTSQMAHPGGVYPGFNSKKRLRVLALFPGRDVSSLQGYPPAFHQVSQTICRYPFILLGKERYCETRTSGQ